MFICRENVSCSLYISFIECSHKLIECNQSFISAYWIILVMAGYMRKLTPVVLDAFPDRVLNLHPALLPSFKGAHAIQDAWDAGVKVTGVTVHLANEDYDKGPIVAQRAVPVLEGDDIDALEARIHETEHVIYPEVLRAIAEGRMTLDADRKIHIQPLG